ncbi:hypothetical protein B0A48_11865 [Cryoendolithus antarcticus]|uniref:Rpr2-domain-containing protein n=1 Tax=Cryoendolithus antarcticus TaxID=1507870 RepID=A0A1V8STG8_9PEZI|nr:hypothetical protein B0A48_11865 [Cryoendolithus antarcticus]
MGKGKNSKGAVFKHGQARIDHLQRIAQYLIKQAHQINESALLRPADSISPPQSASDGIVSESDHAAAFTAPAPGTSSDPAVTGSAVTSEYHFPGLPNLYTSHLTSIARKTQIRLPPQVKHNICKRCSTPLLSHLTCTTRIENLSRDGGKPWADVQTCDCRACGSSRRVPVGAKRQLGKAERDALIKEADDGNVKPR